MSIKILSWNVRGLNNRDRRRLLKEMVRKSKAEVVLVQESKLELVDCWVIYDLNSFSRTGWISLPSIGAARGVIIFWNKDCIEELASRVDKFSTSLTVVCSEESLRWCISVVYGLMDSNLFSVFLDELDMLKPSSKLPWCIGGDFNEVLFLDEKSNGGRRTKSMELFGDFVDRNNLLDFPCSGPRFTWSHFQDRPVMSRLDRFLVSPD